MKTWCVNFFPAPMHEKKPKSLRSAKTQNYMEFEPESPELRVLMGFREHVTFFIICLFFHKLIFF